MSEGEKPRGYLAKYGARLIDSGYRIVPILRGEKVPPLPKWTSIDATERELRLWKADKHDFGKPKGVQGFRGLGASSVGIQTRDNPAVDIDVRDEDVAMHMERFVHDRYGLAPVRVGLAPKRLLVFRTSQPFAKIPSTAYNDDAGRKAQVEILCNGQQFVAFAKHEDTGKPYQWLYQDGPHLTPSADLPELTIDQAREIVEEFERVAEERGWEIKRKQRDFDRQRGALIDRDDPFADVAEKATIDEGDLEKRLMLIPNEGDDYEKWLQIGMALFHQYDGEDRGLELWMQWSEQAGGEHSVAAFEDKWATFKIEGKGRQPITARYILKLSAEHLEAEIKEQLEQAEVDIQNAPDIANLRAICARLKTLEFDPLLRNFFVGLVQDRYKAIKNKPLPIGMARDLLRFERKPDMESLPRWLEGFVYCQQDEIFYSTTTRLALTTKAFNDAFGRHLLTEQEKAEGKSSPEQLPSSIALNLFEIPVVYRRAYMPGEEELFWLNGIRYVNTYDGRNVPTVPEKVSRKDRENVERIFGHYEHLFTNAKDRRLLIDSMAYVIQNPGKRLNYALLMQGVEGDGKTFFFRLLAAMLGLENVTTIAPQAVEETFTPWAEGSQVAFIEEIRLHGHSRHDVLNRLKPLITNAVIPIRRMRMDTYNVINMTTYMIATNYRDALPIGDGDSRYAIFFSRFKTRQQLQAFTADNPDYYPALHEALVESAGAIRKAFLEWELSPEFDADARAPETEARAEMISYAKSDEHEALDAVLTESKRLDMTRTLLNATDLADEFDKYDAALPFGKGLNRFLIDAGFTQLPGRVRIDGKQVRLWSQEPDRFVFNGRVSTTAIDRWLNDDL